MRDDFRTLRQRRDLTDEEMRSIPARANINNRAMYEFFCRRYGVPVERILSGTDVSPEEFLDEKLWTDPVTARTHDLNAVEAFPGIFHHRDAFREGQTFVDMLPNLHIIYFRLLPIRSILAHLDRGNEKFNNEYRLDGFAVNAGSAQVMLEPYPYRIASLVGQECNFVRGVLQANFTVHDIKEATVTERYCSMPLRNLVDSIYRRLGISYREHNGSVYLDGEEVAQRVVLEPSEIEGRTVYRVSGPLMAARKGEAAPPGQRQHTALQIVRTFRRDGRVLFHKGEIYDAPHCLFDLRWRSRTPLSAAWSQLRTMLRLHRVTRREMNRHIEHSNRQYFELLEQKQLTIETLESAARQKDAFLISTAHDLRTPLNGIIGLLDNGGRVLEEAVNGDGRDAGNAEQRVRHSIELALGSARRLSHLINDILDFSRLREGEIQISRREVDVIGVLQTTIETIRPLLGNKDVKLRLFQPAGEALTVYGDENRLSQVFFNLLGNAVKLTEHGHIHVSCGLRESVCEVAVSDTGIGIPAYALAKIFEEYEQGDSERGRVYGGSGIGLAVVKRIVELHGGEVSVESTEGEGSTFTVRLSVPSRADRPAAGGGADASTQQSVPSKEPTAASVPQPIVDPWPSASGTGMEIWVCDDDAVNLEVLQSMLACGGYAVRSFLRGEGLLAALKTPAEAPETRDSPSCRPGAVLLDVMMPGIGGLETCRRIRERYPVAELPVIMITARAFPEDLAAGFDAGASDYLGKPVVRRELLARMELHLSITRAFTAQRLQETRLRLLDSVLALIGLRQGAAPDARAAATQTFTAEDTSTAGATNTTDSPQVLAERVPAIVADIIRCIERSCSGDSSEQCVWNEAPTAELRETLSRLGREHARLLTNLPRFSRSEAAAQEFSAVLEKLFAMLTSSSPRKLSVDPKRLGLSEREGEIVEHVCLGYGNQEIAAAFVIRENTVKRHLYNVFNKLGVDSRAQLIYKILASYS